MERCGFVPGDEDGPGPCPRPAADGGERCPVHLSPADRRRLGVGRDDVRATVRADVAADDDRRRTYADAEFEALDLGSLLLDGDHVDALEFRAVTVAGEFDLSRAVVRHPVVLERCRVGRLDCTGATFEGEVAVEASTVGDGEAPTAVECRRATFEGGVRLAEGAVDGGVELAACRVGGWLTLDAVTVAGPVHAEGADLDTAQVVDGAFEAAVSFAGATADHLAFEDARFGERVDLSGASVGELRANPDGDATFDCREATVAAGRLDQPSGGAALYELTDATVGDVALGCDATTFDRYRFYRTAFDGFPFARYRRFLRANGWRLHEYAGEPAEPDDVEGLELTYLAARRGASAVGDAENASAFFVRELRYRRRRYAAHALDGAHTRVHRTDAALRWATNAFLDAVAGYGERPQRVVAIALAAIVGCALAFPATGGLATSEGVVTYGSDGAAALVDGLYFSVVTFATLGLGDVAPAGDVARVLAAGEALLGAFLTALFVFSLGRRVTR